MRHGKIAEEDVPTLPIQRVDKGFGCLNPFVPDFVFAPLQVIQKQSRVILRIFDDQSMQKRFHPRLSLASSASLPRRRVRGEECGKREYRESKKVMNREIWPIS